MYQSCLFKASGKVKTRERDRDRDTETESYGVLRPLLLDIFFLSFWGLFVVVGGWLAG